MDALLIEKWVENNGDYTHRIDYNLNEKSIVFDVGGYKGDWSELISDMYDCNIFIFEPIKNFYNDIVHRFKGNPKIKVFNYGLAAVTKMETFNYGTDETSSHRAFANSKKVLCKVKCIGDIINELNIKNIDLIKINIEGEEYPLLKYIINKNIHQLLDNIQIQFHDWINQASNKRNWIRKNLLITHELTYDYRFIWENWKRRK